MPDLVPVRRALLSVSDKTGLVAFATALHQEFNVELLSTGGTAKALRDAGLPVTDVSSITGFPEIMDGRVKTLHPKIHGGLLGRLPQDEAVMAQHGIQPIDLVVINLYPFEQTISKEGFTEAEAIEQIDIGGPAMIRAAAKNFERVAVVTDPISYEQLTNVLRRDRGQLGRRCRMDLARQAFHRTSIYDESIGDYFRRALRTGGSNRSGWSPLNSGSVGVSLAQVSLELKQSLRYGENPHQQAALYADTKRHDVDAEFRNGLLAFAEQRHGKPLSYINLLDADAALNCVREFNGDTEAACCIVKHATPCGASAVARASRTPIENELSTCETPVPPPQAETFIKALAGDPVAAFGGIVAFNLPINLATAKAMTEAKTFLEVIVAPYFDDDALAVLQERWKNVRLLAVGNLPARPAEDEVMLHKISGGYLVQQADMLGAKLDDWKTVTQRSPTVHELADLRIAWLICKHVKSNAIVLVRDGATVGIGGGQVDRVGAAEIAIRKAGSRAVGTVCASDAFFPFPDGPSLLLEAGVVAFAQPGGSVRDAETVAAVDMKQAAMVMTGVRHFRH